MCATGECTLWECRRAGVDALISKGMASELENGAMDRKVCEKGEKVCF